MSKLYFAPIRVECEGDVPSAFTWRMRRHRIKEILNRWTVQVEWWRKEIARHYFKVECDNLGVYEIYQEGGRWILERIYD